MWRLRAVAEWRDAARTWLATMTLRPEAYVHCLSRARSRLAKAGTDYEALDFHARYVEVESEGFAEIQRWIKRLRKNTGAPLRYLCVSEAHKTGVPHWHLLIHELDESSPIRHRVLSGSWKWGFDDYRLLVDQKAASYVAKYLQKSVSARVRASARYGRR